MASSSRHITDHNCLEGDKLSSTPLSTPFDFRPRTCLVFGSGTVKRLADFVIDLGVNRPLLVADQGLIDAGHVTQVESLLKAAGIKTVLFNEFSVNPDTKMIAAGCNVAASSNINGIIGLGGGSSMGCAKGINLLLTNGGQF